MRCRLPPAHCAAALVTALFLLFFASRGYAKALRPQGNDFTVYYRTAQAVLAGQNPNRVPKHIYPPAFALAVAPLGLLPYPAAAALWTLLELAALAFVARELLRVLAPGGAPLLLWAPTACTLRLLDSEFANGQVNLVTLALVVLSWRLLLRGRGGGAGGVAAAATVLKVLPGFLALYFLARGRRRALTGFLLGVLIGGLVVPSIVFGPRRHGVYLREWWTAVPAPYLAGGRRLLAARAYLPGQSLTAVLYRLFTTTPARWRGVRPHLAAWDPDRVAWLVRAAGLILLVLLLAALRGPSPTPADTLRSLALVLTTALLVGPLVHKAHMVWVLPAYAVVLTRLWGPAPRPPLLLLHRGLFFLSLLGVTASAPGLVGRPLATGLLSHNVVGLGVLLLHGQLLLLHRGRRPGDAPPRW